MEVHEVTLSIDTMSITVGYIVDVRYIRTGSEEKMGPSGRRLTMNELFFYS
jgi:hypothetical protein